MTTEGTYPYFLGGVSSWCKLLIAEIDNVDWLLVPIVPATIDTKPIFQLPDHASVATPIRLWSLSPARNGRRPRRRVDLTDLPSALARALLAWDTSPALLVPLLVTCRLHASGLRHAFRSRRAWSGFTDTLREMRRGALGDPALVVETSVAETVQLYQTLYWIAQTAAAPTPPADLIHVTAAGWAAIPALVDQALNGTPILLTEHGMYMRESYLGSVLRDDPPGFQWINTRIARALSIAACRAATVVSPVTSTHVAWEELLGTEPSRIRPIPNGVRLPDREPPPLPGTKTVVMVGRFDPLKDIHTALRTAAHVVRQVPEARFLHYGPVDVMQKAYAESCYQLHEQLGLGDSFQFMGSTNDVTSALHGADAVISTSISEGLPIAVLEAMAQGRPVAATAVGGVRDTLNGCGLVTAPRDPRGLATAVVTLLRNPTFAQQLGTRSYERVTERYPISTCVDAYRDLLAELLDGNTAPTPERGHLRLVCS
ncbi:MAG: glycosyl transferase group 1 [Actinomycetia bacterium]|nr:glycosyl transferase group 1 [Actinomycetes bacterium]